MRKILIAIVLILTLTIATASPGCSRAGSAMNGSGEIKDQDLKLTDFDTIEVHGPFELEIVQDTAYKAILSTDTNLISRVKGSLDRKTLTLSIEAPATFFPTSLKVKIAMPKMSGISLFDGAKANILGFKLLGDFNLYLKKDCILNGSLEAGDIHINLSDDSQAKITGKVNSLDLQCSGGSKIGLDQLATNSAQVKLTEASEATLNVAAELDVNMNGASKIYYIGNPLISNTSISGGSTMIRE